MNLKQLYKNNVDSILQYPHKSLTTRTIYYAAPYEEKCWAANILIDLMFKNRGLGLSASQIDLNYSMFVYCLTGSIFDKVETVINPIMLSSNGREILEEGCLSLPNVFVKVERGKEIDVEYEDLKGKLQKRTLRDMGARIFQHELDHCLGRLIIDYK